MNITTTRLFDLDGEDLFAIRELTKPGSDFRKAIDVGILAGLIAVVEEEGEIIGWCRTQEWTDGSGESWETLEAFVDEEHRMRGIASAAARTLYAAHFYETGSSVAVFTPEMMLVARSAGFRPTLFKREERWVRA